MLLIRCLLMLLLFVGLCVWSLFAGNAVCLVTVDVLCLLLTVPWVELQCVIVVFSDRTDIIIIIE